MSFANLKRWMPIILYIQTKQVCPATESHTHSVGGMFYLVLFKKRVKQILLYFNHLFVGSNFVFLNNCAHNNLIKQTAVHSANHLIYILHRSKRAKHWRKEQLSSTRVFVCVWLSLIPERGHTLSCPSEILPPLAFKSAALPLSLSLLSYGPFPTRCSCNLNALLSRGFSAWMNTYFNHTCISINTCTGTHMQTCTEKVCPKNSLTSSKVFVENSESENGANNVCLQAGVLCVCLTFRWRDRNFAPLPTK